MTPSLKLRWAGRQFAAGLFFVLVGAAAAQAAGPDVSVATLAGEPQAGQLSALSKQGVTFIRDGAEVKVPLTDLMEVRLAKPGEPVAIPEGAATVRLVDGSVLPATKVSLTRRDATIESPVLGSIKVPANSVASIRFAPPDTQIDAAWNELNERTLKQDILVVQKGMVLDHLDGTVGEVSPEKVSFVVDGDEVPVPREKVFGLILKRTKAAAADPLCEATFPGGARLNLRLITWDEGQWQAALMAGGEVRLPAERIAVLDFSAGKIKYLSDLKPREVKYFDYYDMLFTPGPKLVDHGNGVFATPGFNRPWFEIHNDTTNENQGTLELGGKRYSRGVWMHSRTQARYRIGGDYRRFQAVLGIDYRMVRISRGNVMVTILGDGKPLFNSPLTWSDEPTLLDLDVTDVRDVEIEIGFGEDLDVGDHVVFGNAKFLK